MSWMKCYGDCEGPLGFPMSSEDAKALEALMESNPDHEFERLVTAKATAELSPGERADISWIMTEALDRKKDVVLLAGFDDSAYRSNPIVTLNHDYTREPVGKSLWRRRMREDGTRGIKAKTVYPSAPSEWDASKPWPSDAAFALVKAGLMSGKSIGFLTLEASGPTDQEVARYPEWKSAFRIVRKWALVEVACCWLPVNQDCVVEAVSKSLVTAEDLKAFGLEVPQLRPDAPPGPKPGSPILHTPLPQIEAAIQRAIGNLDMDKMVRQAIDRATGKVA